MRHKGRMEFHVAEDLESVTYSLEGTGQNNSVSPCNLFSYNRPVLARSVFSTQAWETAALGRATLGMPDKDNNEETPFFTAEFKSNRLQSIQHGTLMWQNVRGCTKLGYMWQYGQTDCIALALLTKGHSL